MSAIGGKADMMHIQPTVSEFIPNKLKPLPRDIA